MATVNDISSNFSFLQVTMASSPTHKKVKNNADGEPVKLASATELQQFDKLFPELVESITKGGLRNKETLDGMKWFQRVGTYGVQIEILKRHVFNINLISIIRNRTLLLKKSAGSAFLYYSLIILLYNKICKYLKTKSINHGCTRKSVLK